MRGRLRRRRSARPRASSQSASIIAPERAVPSACAERALGHAGIGGEDHQRGIARRRDVHAGGRALERLEAAELGRLQGVAEMLVEIAVVDARRPCDASGARAAGSGMRHR